MGSEMCIRDSLGSVAEQAVTIVSTHLVEDIIDHADTITIMNTGRLCFDGSVEDFSASRSLEAVRDAYLGLVS